MKGRQVVLGRHFGGEAAALMVDGQLQDLLFDLSGLTPLPPGAMTTTNTTGAATNTPAATVPTWTRR